jgi:hypothetical protein
MRGDSIKVRLSLALIACVVGASLIPGSAAADRPEKETISPVGDEFRCGGTLLTVKSGILVDRRHVHERKSGRFRVIFVTLTKGVTAEDEEGVVYRVVGVVHGNFTTSDPDANTGDEVGFLREKLNFIGPGGLFGTLDLRTSRKKKDEPGDFTVRDKGNCRLD